MTPDPCPFAVGDRVVLARVVHPEYVGKTGTVYRIVKSRATVKVRLDAPPTGPQIYAAFWRNVDREVVPA